MSEREPLKPLSAARLQALEREAETYSANLSPEAIWYLEDRGFRDETVESARLGSVTDPLPGHERYRDWLAIPYLGPGGIVLQIRFRCIADHDHRELGHGKYATQPGEPARVYGIDSLHRAGDTLHITEGELDRLILEQCGVDAVALPGAAMWSGRHRQMFEGFSRIYVWADPDEAGSAFAGRILNSLPQAVQVPLGAGDVNETYLAGGCDRSALLSLI